MPELPKFKRSKQNSDEEKAIIELNDLLVETHTAFFKLNCNNFKDINFFKILRNGCLGYCGATIDILSKMISDKNQQILFIGECTEIFNHYMRQALNEEITK